VPGGAIAAIKDTIDSFGDANEILDYLVVSEWPSDAVHLSSVVFPGGVGKKQNPIDRSILGRYVDPRAILLFPNRVKFGLDKYMRPLPDLPPNDHPATMRLDGAFNIGKALIDQIGRRGRYSYIGWSSTSHNVFAESEDLGS
jgi:hypothetical protein